MVQDRQHEGRDSLRRLGDVVFGADKEVAEWVSRRVPGYTATPDARALGIIRSNKLVAGVTYENFNGVNVECAIASVPGSNWATRRTLHAIFDFPFNQLGCRAITILVASTNLISLNLVTKMGFIPEAFVGFAAHDGSSLVVLKMFRENCKWINRDGQEQRQRTSGT